MTIARPPLDEHTFLAQPNVTVIIPCHEDDIDSAWTKQAVASFRDNTPVVLAPNSGNLAEAVNKAAQEATTKWLLVFSNDNVAAPFMLDHLMSMGFGAEVVYPGVMGCDETMEEELWTEPVPPFCANRLLSESYIPAASLVLRKAFLELGGYRDLAAPLEAWDLYVRGVRAGWRFKPCQVTFYQKRVREGRTAHVQSQVLREEVVGEAPEMLATFYYQATHACAYLRAILPARHLPGVALGDLYATMEPVEGVTEIKGPEDVGDVQFPFQQGEAAVLQFAGDMSWALMHHHLQLQGIRTLVEVDDNYLHDPGKRLRQKSNWGRKIGEAQHTYEGHRYIVKWADGVIVTTEALRDSYLKFNENVFVIPNPVDEFDWKYVKRNNDDVFRIGWCASASHYSDIPLVTRALEWASRQKDVEVVCLGINPKWKFPYTQLPWVEDLDAYRLVMGQLDVGICPVVPDHFSVFRSDVKSSEYNMGGAAVICSDVPPYSHRVHESDCLKAKDAKDFYHHIKRLVGNREETRQLAAAGRAWVDENRNIRKLIPLWREALQVEVREKALA